MSPVSDGVSTWFEGHHVVVALGDAAHSGGASQAAQARLPRPAALALHQRVKRSVEPCHKTKQSQSVCIA